MRLAHPEVYWHSRWVPHPSSSLQPCPALSHSAPQHSWDSQASAYSSVPALQPSLTPSSHASPWKYFIPSGYSMTTIWPYCQASFFLGVGCAMSSLLDCEGLEDSVNSQKEYICQERFLVVNCAQIHNQSLAAIADRGFSYTLHFREKTQIEISTSHTGLLLRPLIREFLVSYFDQWTKTCLVQSELCSYILICIYINQSELLHNNQSEHTIFTTHDCAIWTNQLCKF